MYKKRVIAALILSGVSLSSVAYESTGFLSDLFVSKQGQVLFKLANPVNQRPKCATNSDWDYQLDLNQMHAAHMLNMLKTSQQIAKPLTVGYGPEAVCGKKVAAIMVDYVLFKNLYQQKKNVKNP